MHRMASETPDPGCPVGEVLLPPVSHSYKAGDCETFAISRIENRASPSPEQRRPRHRMRPRNARDGSLWLVEPCHKLRDAPSRVIGRPTFWKPAAARRALTQTSATNSRKSMERSKCPRKAFAPRTPPRPFPDVSEMQKVSAKANPAIGVSDPREGTGAQRRGKKRPDYVPSSCWRNTAAFPRRSGVPPGVWFRFRTGSAVAFSPKGSLFSTEREPDEDCA